MPQVAGLRGAIAKPGEETKRDPTRAMYRYHQVFAGPGRSLTRKSLFCAVQLTPYSEGAIRPHEQSSPAGRDAALAKIKASGTHTEPVLFGYRDPANEIERLCRKAESGTPIIDFKTPDGVAHKLWRVGEADTVGAIRRYFAPKKLHLLDGHDRYEAMMAYREELTAKAAPPTYSSANFGLAVLTSLDDPTLATAPRHRMLKTAIKRDEAFAALGKLFIVDKLDGAAKDVGKQVAALTDTVAHQPAFVAVFASETDAYKLTLSPDVSPIAEGVQIARALQKLDPVVVQMAVDKAFPKAESSTTIDANAALAQLGKGADVVLVTRPLSVEQIAHVDELGGMMPAGSTAFHPPIAALVTMVIDPDEDLV